MRKNPTKRIEQYRVTTGPRASSADDGANGAFLIPFDRVMLRVIVSDDRDWEPSGMPPPAWEHVSVSLPARCPTWQEMDFIKRIFWGDEETVIQLHVPRDSHINNHDFCLHLWKPVGVEVPRPPLACV